MHCCAVQCEDLLENEGIISLCKTLTCTVENQRKTKNQTSFIVSGGSEILEQS